MCDSGQMGACGSPIELGPKTLSSPVSQVSAIYDFRMSDAGHALGSENRTSQAFSERKGSIRVRSSAGRFRKANGQRSVRALQPVR